MAQLLSSATCSFPATSFFSQSQPLLLPHPNPNPRSFFRHTYSRRHAARVSCLFSDARKREEARKALENALSQKKGEFDKWNKQIEKTEQKRERGGGAGRGGRFGGGGWYGWFGGDEFWEEPKKVVIVIFGIGLLYLLITKGEAISPVIFNSLLGVLGKVRSTLEKLFSGTPQGGQVPVPVSVSEAVNKSYQTPTSAKERVVRKWGMD